MIAVVCITGASGVIYGIKLMEELQKKGVEVDLVISEQGKEIIGEETPYSIDDVLLKASKSYSNSDLFAPIASGSFVFDMMAVVPCSLSTLAKIACGVGDDLITRCATVALKERRKLLLSPRDMPLDTIALENMVKLSSCGVVIAPPIPGFYGKPRSLDDVIDFVVGKILDSLDVDNDIYGRFEGRS